MKRSIYVTIILINILFLLSCSNYSIKNDIKDNAILSKIKNTGIIFRISKSSKITREEILRNTQYWLGIHQKKADITVITDPNELLGNFQYPQERFYQLSNENKYLKYKSIGVVNLYLQNNRNELLNIISRNNLDSLIIFEIFSVISTELRFFEFESVLAIADSSLNIAYLDHQSDYFESMSSSLNDLKNQTMDIINNRLVNNLEDLDLLGKQTENGKNSIKLNQEIKPEEKPGEKSIEKPLENSTEKPSDISNEKSEEQSSEIQKENNTETHVLDKKEEVASPSNPSQEIKEQETPSSEKAVPEN